MAEKIPATVITGFLGAGKTSLIRHLLATANGKKLALIINEFGDLGVDGEILKGCGVAGCEDEDILELPNGCICCTVADDFIPTIEAILSRVQKPDHIVIETSGLALPKPLVKAFNWPEIRTQVTVDGVITVVDGPAVADGLFADNPLAVQAQREADEALDHESPLEELFEEQLSCADMVLINKTDLLSEEQLSQVNSEVSEQLQSRPAIKLLHAANGAIDASVLLGLEAAAEDDLDARPSHHDNGEDHEHDDFLSFVVELPEIGDPESLIHRLQTVVAGHDILRVKGFAAVTDKSMRLLIQGVGARFQHYYDRAWRAHESRLTRLVVIGTNEIDEVAIRVALQQH